MFISPRCFAAAIAAAIQTGLRVSELAQIKVGDVDLKRGSLRVWRLKRRERKQETIAVNKELTVHLKEFIEWKKLVGQSVDQDAPLFVGKRGPLTARGLQQLWKSAVKKAGLPEELSIHSARHTIAVHLLRKTGNLRMVQKQLGHASPATTANMYADVSFEDMQNGLNGLYTKEHVSRRAANADARSRARTPSSLTPFKFDWHNVSTTQSSRSGNPSGANARRASSTAIRVSVAL